MALAATMSDHNHSSTLLERDEAGRVGGAETGAAVGDGLVGDGELAEVVTDHTGLHTTTEQKRHVSDSVPTRRQVQKAARSQHKQQHATTKRDKKCRNNASVMVLISGSVP